MEDPRRPSRDLRLVSGVDVGSRIRVRDAVHGSPAIRRAGEDGGFVPGWNATLTESAPF